MSIYSNIYIYIYIYTTDEGSCITTETFGYYKNNYWFAKANIEQWIVNVIVMVMVMVMVIG